MGEPSGPPTIEAGQLLAAFLAAIGEAGSRMSSGDMALSTSEDACTVTLSARLVGVSGGGDRLYLQIDRAEGGRR